MENDLLQCIRGEGKQQLCRGITSYPFEENDNNIRIHNGCLKLEKQGLIYRKNENEKSVLWMPVEGEKQE